MRLARDTLQDLEEFLTTRRLAVECDQKRLVRPVAVGTPRRVENRLVEDGAQRVAGGKHVFGRDLVLPRTILEGPHFLDCLPAQALDVRIRDLATQAAREHEQRNRGLHQGVGAGLGKICQRCRRSAGAAARQLGAAPDHDAALGAPLGADACPSACVGYGAPPVDRRHWSGPGAACPAAPGAGPELPPRTRPRCAESSAYPAAVRSSGLS